MCNDVPAAPEVSSTNINYDAVAGDAYLAWAAIDEDYRNKYDKFCGVDTCYNMMQM
jgi:hypothetical protein